MHNYKELKISKKGRELTRQIYLVSEKFPESEKFGLCSQIRRSAVSLVSNIAEGAGRRTDREFIRFLDIAFGSAYELETQLIIAHDILINNRK
jgi:four helix bundle protein